MRHVKSGYNRKSMSVPVFQVSVVVRRVPIVNRWVSEKWEIEAVEPVAAGAVDISSSALRAEAPHIVRDVLSDDRARWHGFRLDLHPSEAEGYYLNLREPEPRVFVMWRLEQWPEAELSDSPPVARPWVVTASYNEAARMMDGGETVDSVPMDQAIRSWIEPWLVLNYKPEPRKKKERNQAFWGDRKGSDGSGGRPSSAADGAPAEATADQDHRQ